MSDEMLGEPGKKHYVRHIRTAVSALFYARSNIHGFLMWTCSLRLKFATRQFICTMSYHAGRRTVNRTVVTMAVYITYFANLRSINNM